MEDVLVKKLRSYYIDRCVESQLADTIYKMSEAFFRLKKTTSETTRIKKARADALNQQLSAFEQKFWDYL